MSQFLQKNVHQGLKSLARPVAGGADGSKEVPGAGKKNDGAGRAHQDSVSRQITASYGGISQAVGTLYYQVAVLGVVLRRAGLDAPAAVLTDAGQGVLKLVQGRLAARAAAQDEGGVDVPDASAHVHHRDIHKSSH